MEKDKYNEELGRIKKSIYIKMKIIDSLNSSINLLKKYDKDNKWIEKEISIIETSRDSLYNIIDRLYKEFEDIERRKG